MKDKLTEKQTVDILESLDNAIKDGPWEESNFLRAVGKSLQEIRQHYVEHIESNSRQIKDEEKANLTNLRRITQKEIFVSLYSSEGDNLQSWERIVANLPKQMVSRPIYGEESEVIQWMKSKPNRSNEAYVSFHVEENDILSLAIDKAQFDKFGKPLLVLKDRALRIENINRFVHTSGTYSLRKGRLIKNQPSNED